MKFAESNNPNCLEFKNIPQTFIYFLTYEEEVVYVGQTNQGLFRPLTHRKDKVFDDIWVIPCKSKDLDKLEDKYIKKYLPKYNKQLNKVCNYSISKCIEEITLNYTKYNKAKFKRLVTTLNVPMITFNGITYLSKQDFKKVCKHIEKEVGRS